MPQSHPGNHFDTLRVLFASFVVFSHSYALGVGSEATEPIAYLSARLFDQHVTLGELAVDGFFVISGFLIAKSWERRRSTLDFLSKRVRRIYPGFVVAALIGSYLIPYVAVSAPDWQHGDLWDFVARTLRLRDRGHPLAFAENAYPHVTNGSLWSIQYEFWCYLGVAVLGLSGVLARRRLLVALFIASLFAAYLFAFAGWRPSGGMLGELLGYPPAWARLLPFYLAGVVAYRYRDLIPYSKEGALLAVVTTLLMGWVDYSWSFVLPLTWAYLIFFAAFLDKRPIAATAYGDCSYGTYLYAFPIQQLCVMAAGGHMHPLALFTFSLPLSLVAGFISWHAVERWFVTGCVRLPAGGPNLATAKR